MLQPNIKTNMSFLCIINSKFHTMAWDFLQNFVIIQRLFELMLTDDH